MSFAKYSEYKERGVAWIGPVPGHWEVCSLKRIVKLRSGEFITALAIDDTGEYPVYGGNGLRGYTSRFTHEGEFALVGRQGALCGNVNYASGRFWASEHALVAAPVRPVSLFWLGEMLRSMNLNQYSVTAAQPGLAVGTIENIATVYPPYAEQEAITGFLQQETRKIDGLIDEQRRLIGLLIEKRQAIISHAVTSGLNPDAPMKPSGVEWLGDVPAHWDISRCRRYVSILPGFAFSSSGFTTDQSEVRLLRGVNVGVRSIRWDDVVYWRRRPEDSLDVYSLRSGDIVIGMDRPVISGGVRVAKIMADDVPSLLLQRVAALRPSHRLNPDYLIALLSSQLFVAHFAPETTGVSVPHISPEQIGSFVIPVPPREEQDEIAAQLAAASEVTTDLTRDAERSIDLLEERRTALISAAVTGQIDVRGHARKAAPDQKVGSAAFEVA